MKFGNYNIVYSVISGSCAYGTNIPSSDIDIKGVYLPSVQDYVSLFEPEEQFGDEKGDEVYWEMKKFFNLLSVANPTALEVLFTPKELYRVYDEKMNMLMGNKNIFITKKAYNSFCGYAVQQIKKAKGANKRVNNPQPKERPVKEDFCRVISIRDIHSGVTYRDVIVENKKLNVGLSVEEYPVRVFEQRLKAIGFPFRPKPIHEIDLSKFNAASLENTPNTYRLYYYGDEAKGVFRGDDNLVCESIPMSDEWDKIYGLLIYNENEYKKAVREWKQYWEWMEKRNEHRWIDQEKGKLDYDQKNMMHCMRLLMSAENIFVNGEPLVRFEGEKLNMLMEIRRGEWEYAKVMSHVEALSSRVENLYEKSELPEEVDRKLVNEIFMGISYA